MAVYEFLTNTFKELTSVNDVPEIYANPITHPKPKFLQHIKNQNDRRAKTFHNMTCDIKKDNRSTNKTQFQNKPLNSTKPI